ncbi:MAG: peptidoglycan DD-metalloendopeptidase family protein [Bacteroidales bacterium]|nr:peptidoglycan DD-metalloendopeptidase family protein [Bacteroidales bacterium]MBR6161141.1 peptidoglycan DD-metalloendopeptidase family protein [Bacteroidales bacterium]
MPKNSSPSLKHIFLILMMVPLLWVQGAFAQTKSSSQLKKDKQKIENEIANTQSLLKKTEKNQKASLQQIAVLRQQISNREKLITALNNEIMQMEEQQELNQQMIAQLQKKLEYMKSDYAQVVYMAYRNRRLMDKVTFILASDDFSQMFRRFRFFTLFSKNVKEQADKIDQTQQELKQKNEEIIALKNEKLNLLSGKETEIKKLESDRREKTRNAEQLKKQSQQLAADLKAKQKKRKELDAAIKRAIEAEIAAANQRKANTKGSSKPSTSTTTSSKTTTSSRSTATITMTPEEKTLNTSFINNKGRLPWPVAKGAKVGDYGNYAHPDVPSVTIENRGIDILTDAGAPVRAVFEGEVTSIMDIMGTKVVMIRHGEYISVYQNLANVNVSKGAKVSTKQTIGTVAKNVSSNTYELHFEIWRNSSNLNPNDWLTRR